MARKAIHHVRPAVALAVFGVLMRAAMVTADPVMVFILAGQSNAVGYGSEASLLPPPLDMPQTDVRFWFDEGPFFALFDPSLRIDSGDMLVALQYQSDPSGLTFATTNDGFGSEIKLGRTLADALALDVAIVKFAVSGSSLAVDWNPATAGSLYHQMRDDVAGALAALAAAGDSGQVAGVFWMQGEADAMTSDAAAAYETNLTSFIGQLRTDFASTGLPFVLGRINVNIDMSCCFSFPYKDDVRTAQANVAGAVSRTVMVDTDDLPLIDDSIHFAAPGQLSLGERFANAYLALPVVCGDGALGAGEECDDGNLVDGDCCSADCLLEDVDCPVEPDELVPGKSTAVKPAALARFVAKPPPDATFALPAPGNDPIIEGGSIRFFDTLPGAGEMTYTLPVQAAPLGWKGIGNPPGSKGFVYKGAGSITDPCTTVVIKPKQVKAVCKGAGITLAPPFAGDLGVIVTAGSASKRYCVSFGGDTKKNATEGFVRKNAPAPPACPVAPPP
jgi:cysteine-rich repeat protein